VQGVRYEVQGVRYVGLEQSDGKVEQNRRLEELGVLVRLAPYGPTITSEELVLRVQNSCKKERLYRHCKIVNEEQVAHTHANNADDALWSLRYNE